MSRTMERMTGQNRHLEPPVGFSVRPATLEDVPAAGELSDLSDIDVLGESTGFGRHFRMFFTSPYVDLQQDSCVLETGDGKVVGCSLVTCEPPHVKARLLGFVHPEYRGNGLGTFLIDWAERRARQSTERAPQGTRCAMHSGIGDKDVAGATLLKDNGLKLVRHFVNMVIDLDAEPEAPVWPEGVELRPVTWDTHGQAIAAADYEIFSDHWGHVPSSVQQQYDHWVHWIENDQDLDEKLWFVAFDGKEIAGVSICWPKGEGDPEKGYIGVLGVRRPWRGKGLGLALLRHSFCEFYRLGKKQAGLHADAENITGALRLYTGVGMRIHRQFDNYEKELRAGKDLVVRELKD